MCLQQRKLTNLYRCTQKYSILNRLLISFWGGCVQVVSKKESNNNSRFVTRKYHG